MHRRSDSVLDPRSQPAPLRTDAALLSACGHLERLLRSGQAARAETYLAIHPALAEDPELALDLIYVEFATRRELGQAPTPAEYLARFPQWRELLSRQFQLEELLNEPLPEAVGGNYPLPPETAPSARFRVQGLLARGGIGQVMRALDTELNREVAVKEIQPHLADNHEVRARFLREAEVTGQLEHPGIVPVYGMGRDASGEPFYAMRLVRGETLQDAAAEFHRRPARERSFHGLEFQKLLRRFLYVCQTLAYAHSRGVIHRDLKPENILLGPFGETLVVDWGLARVTGSDAASQNLPLSPPASVPAASLNTPLAPWSSELTRDAGEWIGTPAFMSPEQAEGGAHGVGPASDVYSLGATLYVLLTGDAPLSGSSVPETLRRAMAGEFPRPRAVCRSVPPPLEAICLKAMARRREDRYATSSDLADDLERWLADEPVTALRESLASRLARWGRRHRTHVIAGAIALSVVAAISLVAAVLINGERLRADRERIEADRRTARLAFDRGYALTEAQEHGAGLLWLARALSHTPPSDADMRRVILTNMDAARHQLLRRRQTFTHDGLISAATFSSDGRLLVSGNFRRGASRRWDVDSGKLLAERQSAGRVVAASVQDDGSAVLAVASGKEVVLEGWPTASSPEAAVSPVRLLPLEETACASFCPAGELLATGGRASGPSQARLWRVASGELLAELPHPSAVNQVAFRPAHDSLATVGADGLVRLWNLKGDKLREFRSETGRIERIAFTPNGKRMIVGDAEGFLSCYDPDQAKRLFELARQSGYVTAVACGADGDAVAAAWSNGTARTWSLATRRPWSELLRIDRHTGVATFRPGSRQLLVAAEPKSATLWELSDPSHHSPSLGQGQIMAVAYSPSGQSAITGNWRGTAHLRNAFTGQPFGQPLVHAGMVRAAQFRADGQVVLTAGEDGTARLWSAVTGEPHGAVMNHRLGRSSTRVIAAAFGPDGRHIATGDSLGSIRLFSGDTGVLVREFPSGANEVRSVQFSPSGDRIVAGYSAVDSSVRVWDVASGKKLWTAQHHDTVRMASFSPDGRLVVSASNDETARLWNAEDGKPVGRAMEHRGEVFVATFSPDGKLAVTGGYDATARLWDVPAGVPRGEPMRHEGVVTDARFSADGRRLVTAGSVDRSSRLWDVSTCLPLTPPLLHNDTVMTAGLHPSGRTALTASLWRLPSALPDEPQILDLWVKLATQRTFASGDNIQWLAPADLEGIAQTFQASTGKSWDQWPGSSSGR